MCISLRSNRKGHIGIVSISAFHFSIFCRSSSFHFRFFFRVNPTILLVLWPISHLQYEGENHDTSQPTKQQYTLNSIAFSPGNYESSKRHLSSCEYHKQTTPSTSSSTSGNLILFGDKRYIIEKQVDNIDFCPPPPSYQRSPH